MGHRHNINGPQPFENEIDQGWNHAEQPYMPFARVDPERSSIIHSSDNIRIQGGQYPPWWAPVPTSTGQCPSIPNVELSHYQPIQPIAPVPSRVPFLHQPAAGNPHTFQENCAHYPSSSNFVGQTIDGGYNQTEGNGRGPNKRKSPSIPPMFEMGSTSSRYYDVGSSSDIHLPTDPWQEKQNTEPYHSRWDCPPSYGSNNNLSIGVESTMRHVRSRASVELETPLARSHLSSRSLSHTFSNQSSDQSNLVDFWGQSSNGPTHEWNHNHIPPTGPYGLISGADSSFLGHDPNPSNTMSGLPNNSSVEFSAYDSDVTLSRNHALQNVGSHLNQSVRGVRSGYGQRSAPTVRASSSNFHPHAPDERQPIEESYPSRHSRVLSNLRLRTLDRNVRTCISSDRYRYLNEEANFRDRRAPEGLMVVDHNGVYGSRTLFDQHRDMRLDIDNMSYEELLALGERIGNVSTGLTDGLISKCLTESIYCSSDLSQDEGNCVICLEEYKNMDDVGTLKVCGHDFHVSCIHKWLSMKNVCPICKAWAMEDSNKET